MNIIKTSKLGKIKSIFNDNETNTHYYNVIHQALKDHINDVEFAKPILQQSKGVVLWKSIYVGPFYNYKSSNENIKDNINHIIQKAYKKMDELFRNHTDNDFLNNIMELPSEEAIFYTQKGNETIVIFTEWGFVKDEHTRASGILKKLLPSTLKSFVIKFKSNNDEYLANIKCILNSVDINRTDISNSEGFIKVNNLSRGSILSLSSPDNLFENEDIEIDTKEEHTIIVERNFNLSFNVLDSDYKPVKQEEFTFISEFKSTSKYTTNDEGFFNVVHPENNSEFKILSNEGVELLLEKLPNQDKEYTIIYDNLLTEKLEEDNNEIEEDVLSVQFDQGKEPIEIEFLDVQKNPIVRRRVEIKKENQNDNYRTNEDGIIITRNLEVDKKYYVSIEYKGDEWRNELIPNKNKFKYTFILEESKGPIILEFLNRRKKPISNQAVDIYGHKDQTQFITDDYGLIKIDQLDKDMKYCVFMKYKRADWKEEFLHTANDKYTFIVKKKKFLWWWIPLALLFFLLLTLIPTEVNHHYTVLDENTRQPISLASISSSKVKGYQIQNYLKTTDSLGKLSIYYGTYSIYKQIFNKASISISVSKIGYDNLNANIPLGFFRTRNSIIYLSKLVINDEEPIHEEPIHEEPIHEEPIHEEPRESCRVFVSGKLISDRDHGQPGFSEIYIEDCCSEYVGEGEYPDNNIAFPRAVKTTFDGIAIDKGTRVIIYSKKNFQGEVLLDKTGPAIINNVIWKNDGEAKDWIRKVFKAPYQNTFPSNKRYFSNSDMHSWSYGSIKIICN